MGDLVLYRKAKGFHKFSSFVSLHRSRWSAPDLGDAQFRHKVAACEPGSFGTASRRGWGLLCRRLITENDSVHQKAFPIPPGCINASATTISKEISFIQIPQSPLVPRARCAHSSSEEGTGTRSQSCPSLSSPLISPQVIHSLAFYLLDLSFINHKKLAVVHISKSL